MTIGTKRSAFAFVAFVLLTSPSYGAVRPYSPTSPWNTPIPSNPKIHPNSTTMVAGLGEGFGSNATMYTYPIFMVTASTPIRTVRLSGNFFVVTGDSICVNQKAATVPVPIPDGAVSAIGSDGQIVLWNELTGQEWGFWKAVKQLDGSWTATNGYTYNTNWDGIPPVEPTPFGSRGAGVPYLIGLIRPWEIIQGRVDHAIAFAYQSPSDSVVCPATKSDGSATRWNNMAEGTRIQLDPAFNVDDPAYGLSRTGKIVARAMQQYGMILIDGAGHPKIMGEYQATAGWNTSDASAVNYWTDRIVRDIPHTRFRVLVTSRTTCQPEVASGTPLDNIPPSASRDLQVQP